MDVERMEVARRHNLGVRRLGIAAAVTGECERRRPREARYVAENVRSYGFTEEKKTAIGPTPALKAAGWRFVRDVEDGKTVHVPKRRRAKERGIEQRANERAGGGRDADRGHDDDA